MWIRQAKLVNLVIHKKRRCTGCGKGKGIGAPRERMGCMIG